MKSYHHEDKMIWNENKAGNYSIKLMYELLNSNVEISKTVSSLFGQFGTPCFPHEWGFFFLVGGLIGEDH